MKGSFGGNKIRIGIGIGIGIGWYLKTKVEQWIPFNSFGRLYLICDGFVCGDKTIYFETSLDFANLSFFF